MTRIELDGDTWSILAEGATRDGKTYCHLASTTRSRQQRNGAVPLQMGDWIDQALIQAAAAQQEGATDVFDRMTFQAARDRAETLWEGSRVASEALGAFPRGAMGLTPDAVKASPEWRAAKAASDAALARLRDFNRQYTKKFKLEIRAARESERAAKACAS